MNRVAGSLSTQGTGDLHFFGDLLKQYRRLAGLTQESLAERAGYSTVYISMLERGQRAPQAGTLKALSAALELSNREQTALRQAVRAESTLSGPGLIGRTRELQVIERNLGRADPPVLVVAGEPGMGKSQLLGEVGLKATIQGYRVLEGRCLRRGGLQPYTPLLEAVKSYLSTQLEEQLRDDLRGCSWLVRLLPELAEYPIEPLPSWVLPVEQERRLMEDAVVRFLRNIAGRTGTLLLLDDLQWAGPDALALLARLAHQAREATLKIVGAYRDIEVPGHHPLSTALADLGQANLVDHLDLGPLSGEEAIQLLDRQLDGVVVDAGIRERILRRADGVPFFLVSCAQGLRSAVAADPIPWNVTQSIRQRVASLPTGVDDLLAVVALIGDRASPSLLRAVVACEDTRLLEGLEAAQAARLLEEDESGAYRITHEVIREVIESDLSSARRAFLHRRLAEEMERLPAHPPAEVLVYHYVRSGETEAALKYLEQAADEARARFAHATAEGYCRELVDRLDSANRPIRAAAAREKLGSLLTIQAQYEEAVTVLEQAVTVYCRDGNHEGEARSVALIGRVESLRGAPEEGIARLEPVRDQMHSVLDVRAEAILNIALAPLYLARGRYADQLAAAEQAAVSAAELKDDGMLAEAEVWRGCALNQLGRWEEGRRVQEEAIPLAENAEDATSLLHALNDVAFGYEIDGQFIRSRHVKERALTVAEQLGDPQALANMTFRCGQNAFLRGDWESAAGYFDRSIALARQIGASAILPYPLFGLALLALHRRQSDEAVSHAEACRAAAESSGDLQADRAAAGLLAEVDLLNGQPERARARLAPYAAQEEGLALRSILPILAGIYLALGDPMAEVWVETGIQQAKAHGNRVSLAESLRVRAAIAVAHGRLTDAERDLTDALAMVLDMQYPLGEAQVRWLYADVLQRVGDRDAANENHVQAEAIYRLLGIPVAVEVDGSALTAG